MPEITIVKNEYASLMYDPDVKIVHHTFHKPIGGQEFRDILLTGIKTLETHKAAKWLSDDRGNSALSPEDTEWSMKNWFPQAIKAGWKYWALVVPQDIFARMNLQEFINSYFDQGLRIAVFTTPEEAREWLINCDK